jgi:hypothetical protein
MRVCVCVCVHLVVWFVKMAFVKVIAVCILDAQDAILSHSLIKTRERRYGVSVQYGGSKVLKLNSYNSTHKGGFIPLGSPFTKDTKEKLASKTGTQSTVASRKTQKETNSFRCASDDTTCMQAHYHSISHFIASHRITNIAILL